MLYFSGGYYSVRQERWAPQSFLVRQERWAPQSYLVWQERWAPQSYLDYYSPLTYTIIVLTDWVTEVAGAYSMVSPQCGLP